MLNNASPASCHWDVDGIAYLGQGLIYHRGVVGGQPVAFRLVRLLCVYAAMSIRDSHLHVFETLASWMRHHLLVGIFDQSLDLHRARMTRRW